SAEQFTRKSQPRSGPVRSLTPQFPGRIPYRVRRAHASTSGLPISGGSPRRSRPDNHNPDTPTRALPSWYYAQQYLSHSQHPAGKPLPWENNTAHTSQSNETHKPPDRPDSPDSRGMVSTT